MAQGQERFGAVARLLSHDAHALRNHVGTLRSIVQLIDDPDIVSALDEASRALQVEVERAIAGARVALGEDPGRISIAAGELVRLAQRRATREGAVGAGDLPDDAPWTVEVPGPWAERLVADLLHHASSQPPALTRTEDDIELAIALERPIGEPLAAVLADLAAACRCRLSIGPGLAELRLPTPAS